MASLNDNTDLFSAESITRLLGHFNAVTRDCNESGAAYQQFGFADGCERHQLLLEWNDTNEVYAKNKCVHELIEAQVDNTPERTALRVGAMALSYAELDIRAARLAQALRSRGVGRGQRVGLCVERGANMVAAMLGILKAGAAYVPLDPVVSAGSPALHGGRRPTFPARVHGCPGGFFRCAPRAPTAAGRRRSDPRFAVGAAVDSESRWTLVLKTRPTSSILQAPLASPRVWSFRTVRWSIPHQHGPRPRG